MAVNMGLHSGLIDGRIKQKFRWAFKIQGVSDVFSQDSVNALPPLRSARPSISFKEMEVRHLIEDVYYPARPVWKMINLTLFDLCQATHPVFEWLRLLYDPEEGTFVPPIRREANPATNGNSFIRRADLELFNGCGDVIERWVFENVWPQNAEFDTLDMGSEEIVTCDVTLRYFRAYIQRRN